MRTSILLPGLLQQGRTDSHAAHASAWRGAGVRLTPAGRRWQKGLTLLELMISTIIASAVVMLVAPDMLKTIRSSRLQGHVNEFIMDLQLARSQAVREGSTVSVCSTSNGQTCAMSGSWTSGWIVFQDPDGSGQRSSSERIVRYRQGLAGGSTLVAGSGLGALTFNAYGFTSGLTGEAVFTAKTSNSDALATRCVRLNIAGRHTLHKHDGSSCK